MSFLLHNQVVKRIVQRGVGPRRPRQDDLVQCFYNGRVETDLLDDDEYTLAQDLLGEVNEFVVGTAGVIQGVAPRSTPPPPP